MCDIVFEQTKGRGGTVNGTSDYAEVAISFLMQLDAVNLTIF